MTISHECQLCGREVVYGHGIYQLYKVSGYNLFVCNACKSGNWDGWHPDYEAKLLEHLKTKGLPVPERTENGLLPYDF